MSAKDLKDKLKALRSEHMGKAIGKMSSEEIQKEIDHHETACRQRELKAKRLEALAKAREEKKAPVKASKAPEPPKKEPKKEKKEKKEEVKEVVKVKKEKKKVVVKSDSEESDTDSSTDTETIKSRIQKKKFANDE